MWKVFNGAIAVLLLGAAMATYQNAVTFLFFGAGLFLIFVLAAFFHIRKSKHEDYQLLPPALFLTGLLGAIAAVAWFPGRIALALIGAALLYFFQTVPLERMPGYFEELFTLAAGFFLLLSLYAANFYLNPDWWMSMMFAFGLSYLSFFPVLRKFGANTKDSSLKSFAMALVVVEFFWATLFWPVFFFTSTVILFAVFYLMYMVTRLYYLRQLTTKKIYFQSILTLLLVLAGLLSSSWRA